MKEKIKRFTLFNIYSLSRKNLFFIKFNSVQTISRHAKKAFQPLWVFIRKMINSLKSTGFTK